MSWANLDQLGSVDHDSLDRHDSRSKGRLDGGKVECTQNSENTYSTFVVEISVISRSTDQVHSKVPCPIFLGPINDIDSMSSVALGPKSLAVIKSFENIAGRFGQIPPERIRKRLRQGSAHPNNP